jgi:hypothetical protein
LKVHSLKQFYFKESREVFKLQQFLHLNSIKKENDEMGYTTKVDKKNCGLLDNFVFSLSPLGQKEA